MAGFTPGHFSLYPRITRSKPRKSTVWKEYSQDDLARAASGSMKNSS
jgi:hypothetical protein